jgi:hypothetical protein
MNFNVHVGNPGLQNQGRIKRIPKKTFLPIRPCPFPPGHETPE